MRLLGLNKYTIKLIEKKQSSYRPIYTLSLVELEILKVYIKTHLKIKFIQPSKSFASAPIFFNKKLDYSLQGLNNFIIKNQYLFLLIDKVLNHLG